jgi:hypothetical protein
MIPADSLREIQLLNIEIGEACNLANRHILCPAHVGDRWRGARDGAPLTDAEIVALVVEAYERLGFRGLVVVPVTLLDLKNVHASAVGSQHGSALAASGCGGLFAASAAAGSGSGFMSMASSAMAQGLQRLVEV